MSQRDIGRVTILDLGGTLSVEQGTEGLLDTIRALALRERTFVVLNLAGIRYMDSEGLGQLVACYSSMARTGGALKLLHVGPRHRRILSITRLLTLFPTFESEDDAIRSFSDVLAAPVLEAGT